MSVDELREAAERTRQTADPADTGEWIANNREMLETVATGETVMAPVIERLLARYDRGEL